MATKRKVDNLLALAVLSTVYQRPMHRYEMASIMRVRGKDQQMNVKWGSLYTVVQNLAKHGFLETIGSTRAGARPERVIYRITEAGVAEMLDWTRELLATVHAEHPRFEAALSVVMALPPAEVITLLRDRLATLETSIATRSAALAGHRAQLPRLFLVETEYSLAMSEAEAAWTRGFLAELTTGTFPDLAAWQTWHDAGEVPPELAELAERGAAPN